MNLRRSKRQTERSSRLTKDDSSFTKTLKKPTPNPKRLKKGPELNKRSPHKISVPTKQTKSTAKNRSIETETNNNSNFNNKKDIVTDNGPQLATRRRCVARSDDYIKRKFLYGVTDDSPKKKRASSQITSKVKSTSAIALVAASSTKLHKKRASKKKRSGRANLIKSRNLPDRSAQLSQSGNESDNLTGPIETGAVDSFLVSEDDDVDAVGLERLLMATQDISSSRNNRKLEKRFFQASRKRPHMKNESSDTDMQDQVDSDQSDDFFMHSDPPQTSYHRGRMAALGAATDAALDDLGSDLDMDSAMHHKSAYPCYRTSGASDDMQEDDNDEDFSGDLLSPNVILSNQHPVQTSVSSSRRKSPIRPMQVLPLDPNHDNRSRRQNIYRNNSPYGSPNKRRATSLGYSESIGHPGILRGAVPREQSQIVPAEPVAVQPPASNNVSTTITEADQSQPASDTAAKPGSNNKDKIKPAAGGTSASNSSSTSSSNSTSNTPGNKNKAPIPPRYRPSILQRKTGQNQTVSQSNITSLPAAPLTSISDLPTATVLPTGNVVLTSDPTSMDNQSVQNNTIRQISGIVTNTLAGTSLSLQHPVVTTQHIVASQVVYQKPVAKPFTASAKLFGKKSQEVNSTETTHVDANLPTTTTQRITTTSVQSTVPVTATVPVVVQPTTSLPYTMVRAATKGKNIVLLGPQTVNSSIQPASIIRPTIVRTNARSILRTSSGAVVTPVVSGGPPISNVSTVTSGQGLIVVRGGDGVTRMLPTCTAASTAAENEQKKAEETDFDRALNTPANPVIR